MAYTPPFQGTKMPDDPTWSDATAVNKPAAVNQPPIVTEEYTLPTAEAGWRHMLQQVTAEERGVLEEELRQSPEWVMAAKTWYEYVNDKPFAGSDQEAVQFGLDSMSNNYAWFNTDTPFSDEENVGLVGFVQQFEDAPDHAQMAAGFLHLMYEEKDITWAGFGRATRANLQDVTNAIGIATVVGLAGKWGGRQLVKQAFNQLIRQNMKRIFGKQGLLLSMGEGAAFAAGDDAMLQGLEAQIGQSELGQKLGMDAQGVYDWQRGGLALAAGGLLGATFNQAIPAARRLFGKAMDAKALSDELSGLSDSFDLRKADAMNVSTGGPIETALIQKAAIKSLLSQYPQAEPLIPFLSPREILMLDQPLMKQRVDNILSAVAKFEEQNLDKEIQSIALAGAAKKGWYKESGQLFLEVFGNDLPRFTALLAGISPKTSVTTNLKNALTIWTNWVEAGRPTDEETIVRIMADSVKGSKGVKSVMPAWIPNAVTALTEDSHKLLLSGSKVDSFMRNIMGDSDAVTLDTWMAKYFGINQNEIGGGGRVIDRDDPGLNAMYQAASIIVRKGAQKLTNRTGETWTPAEIQETVWSYVRTAYVMRREGDKRTIAEIIKSGEITPEVLRGTDDFATLLSADDIGALLKGTTYGERLERAIDRRSGATDVGQGTTTEVSGGSVKPTSRHLVGVGERLERDFRSSAAGEKALREVVTGLRKSLGISPSSRLDGGEVGSTGGVGDRVSPKSTGTFTAGSRRHRTNNLGNLLNRVYRPSAAYAAKLNNLGRSTPPVAELDAGVDAANFFIKGIAESKKQGPYGAAVHVYTPDEYAAMRLFVSNDGTSGFAIKDNGDIVSVFNLKGGPNKQITPHFLMLAIEQGGRRLDCFDTVLPSSYSKVGFRAVARTKWLDAHKPSDWSYETFKLWNDGRPDVVYMIYDPKYVAKGDKKYKITDGPFVADPDEAAALQTAELKKLGLD